ncbi:MAG: pitrilysin family protein [Vicinamibacterales bacterium]
MELQRVRSSRQHLLRFASTAAVVTASALFHAHVHVAAGGHAIRPLEQRVTGSPGVVRKNRAPVAPDPPTLAPRVTSQAVLANGAMIVVLEDHRAPTVTLDIHIDGAGPACEGDRWGLASIAVQLLQSRAARWTVDAAGDSGLREASVRVSAQPGGESATISVQGPSGSLAAWLEATAKLLAKAVVSPDELEIAKRQHRAAFTQRRATPEFLAQQRLVAGLFGSNHADAAAEEVALTALSSEDVTTWYAARYVPGRAVIAVSGHVESDQAVRQVSRAFGEWNSGAPSHQTCRSFTRQPSASADRVHLVERPGSVQTTIVVGGAAVSRRHADYLPLLLMTRILGDGPTSRLFVRLREEKGYTYAVSSTVIGTPSPGMWRLAVDMRNEALEDGIRIVLAELERLRSEAVDRQELLEAKRSLIAHFALSLESARQTLSYHVLAALLPLPPNYWESYPRAVMRVTASDLQRIAKTYASSDTLHIVAVGDTRRLTSVLKN